MAVPDYLQAIYAIWILWGLVWLGAWFWANRTRSAASGANQAPYRLINILGWCGIFGDRLLHKTAAGFYATPIGPQLWHASEGLGWAMAILAAIGMAFALWSRATLGRLWSAAVTQKEGHRIVEQGPYAIVRHPIYTALLAGAIALVVAKGTAVALAGLVLMITGYVLKARLEERFLAQALGEADYAAYRRRVPMLVPFAPVHG